MHPPIPQRKPRFPRERAFPSTQERLDDIDNRLTRIETRLCKLMLHIGMELHSDEDQHHGGNR